MHSLQLTLCNSPLTPIYVLSVRPTTLQTSAIGHRKACIVSSYYMLYPAETNTAPLQPCINIYIAVEAALYIALPRISSLHQLDGGGYNALAPQLYSYTLLK